MDLRRLLMLWIIIDCTILTTDSTIRCEAPPVVTGEAASIKCFFPTDVIQDQREFEVDRYIGNKVDAVLHCYWTDHTKKCSVEPGYRMEFIDTTTLMLNISVAEKQHAGVYICQVVPPEPGPNPDSCTLTVKDQTTTKPKPMFPLTVPTRTPEPDFQTPTVPQEMTPPTVHVAVAVVPSAALFAVFLGIIVWALKFRRRTSRNVSRNDEEMQLLPRDPEGQAVEQPVIEDNLNYVCPTKAEDAYHLLSEPHVSIGDFKDLHCYALKAYTAILAVMPYIQKLYKNESVQVLVIGLDENFILWAIQVVRCFLLKPDCRKVRFYTAAQSIDTLMRKGADKRCDGIVYWNEEQHEREIMDLTREVCGPLDVIIDFVSSKRTVNRSIEVLKCGGLMLFGGRPSSGTAIPVSEVVTKHLTVIGNPDGTLGQLKKLVNLFLTKELIPPTPG